MNQQQAVNLHMELTRQGEAVCKHCGQKITKFLLPFSGQTELSWYHLCVDPKRLGHLRLHTANDSGTCYNPEPEEKSRSVGV